MPPVESYNYSMEYSASTNSDPDIIFSIVLKIMVDNDIDTSQKFIIYKPIIDFLLNKILCSPELFMRIILYKENLKLTSDSIFF